jgi:hypothetical protein
MNGFLWTSIAVFIFAMFFESTINQWFESHDIMNLIIAFAAGYYVALSTKQTKA